MINPDIQVINALAEMGQRYPAVTEWLTRWRDTELNRLPQVPNPAVAQGRCQVLQEITDLVVKAPKLSA